jgi:hypothetical protein
MTKLKYLKMKYKIVLAIFVICFLIEGCEKVLEVNSDRVLPTTGNKLNSPNNNMYYMYGIFSQLSKIAERYVILGELRGDLMDVTKYASLDLQQINNFDISPDNPYVTIKDYYAVINNCNYLIQNIDTSVITGGIKTMYREYAAAKAIRAWTYMQIVLNYGKAVYYEQPLLNVDDATKSYPEYYLKELFPILISDLKPLEDIGKPQYGSGNLDPESFQIGELNSKYFYIPIRFLLGELYLWLGQYDNSAYEKAANEYRDLMYLNYAVTNPKSGSNDELVRSTWNVTNGVFVDINSYSYKNFYFGFGNISEIGTTSQYGEGTHLKDLTINKYMLKPSATSITNWDSQQYYDVNPIYSTYGDLRGVLSAYISNWTDASGLISGTAKITSGLSKKGADNYIFKYALRDAPYKQSELITTCRAGLLYLRYAEAVNRIGKPNLAFAVLKNGLNSTNIANPAIVPTNELPDPRPNYMNFDDVRFANNIGMHARGCGYSENDPNYIIPSLPSPQDSVLYVEDMIQKELALETAFEGNRFHDLMRLALRRSNPSYLANIVSGKHQDSQEAIRAKLLDTDNWYLPKK